MKDASYTLIIFTLTCAFCMVVFAFFGYAVLGLETGAFVLSGVPGFIFSLLATWFAIDRKWRIASMLGVLMFVLYMAVSLWDNYLSMIVGFILVLTVTRGFGEKNWRIGGLVAVVLLGLYMALHLAAECGMVNYNILRTTSAVLNFFVAAVPFVLAGIAVKSLPDAWHRRLLRVGLACGYLMLSYYLFVFWPPYFGWLN